LPEDLERLFKQQLDQLEAEKQMRYITSIERLARQEGRAEGREEGREETALAEFTIYLPEAPQSFSQDE